MFNPSVRQLDEGLLQFLAVIELTLPFCLLMGILCVRFLAVERLKWESFPSMVPLILLVVPIVAALHERILGMGVFFASLYVVSFVLAGMREHVLFYDCALPFVPGHNFEWPRWLIALQVFWFLQAPAAAFNGLDWPRGLGWTQTLLLAIALLFWCGLIIAALRKQAQT